MNTQIQMLDCTLRDGCYIVNSQFGSAAIRGIISKLQEANVELIECGWLKDQPHREGSAFYHVPSDLAQYLTVKDPRRTYLAMIDWDRYQLDALPPCDGKSIDAIRVVFPHGKVREGTEVGRKVGEKGYQVYFQAANTLAYTDEELIELAEAVNAANAVSLSVVDTFGAMYEEDLERIVRVLDRHLAPQIRLGFHSHNNMQLSFALSIHFIKLLQESGRGVVVDASLCGMGRGAGNTTTELLTSYLNRRCGCHYDLDAVLDAIDTYMEYFREHFRWGYSPSYFVAGLNCCHVNNIAYLQENHRTRSRDMHRIIESLTPEDRRKYDYDLLEQKFLANQNRYVDDTAAVAQLRQALAGRSIVLIAPGRRSVTQQEQVLDYIRAHDAAAIAVNALLPGYRYDWAFFVNPARYEYAANANPEQFAATPKILLSCIKHTPAEDELIISYDHAVRRGWRCFDNAVICCLRLMDLLGIESVALAGFDGFKKHYNESYGDPYLPTRNPDGDWDRLNEDVLALFRSFRSGAVHCRTVSFLTESFFNQ